jgi:hypothetical protein
VVYLIGCGILAGVVAGLLALFDFHRTIIENGNGTAPIPYYGSVEAWGFFVAVGSAAIALFAFAQAYPQGWVNKAVGLELSEPLLKGLCIGAAAMVLLRTRVFEVDGHKVGVDYVYELVRTWSIDRYKAQASRLRQDLAKRYDEQLAKMASFDADVTSMLTNAVNHRKDEVRKKLERELKDLMPQSSDPVRYAEYLILLSIDYIGLQSTRRWLEGETKLSSA